MASDRPYNAPGQKALAFRIDDFAGFREAMLAKLSDGTVAAARGLTARGAGEPYIAFLDAWAAVGEVLTFYQERLANEGYLRTAQEDRSVLELARLVGHRPNAGVAASTSLAYTLDLATRTTIPAGSRVQNVPGPGQTAQFYETSEDLDADGALNAIKPRQTRPLQASDDLTIVYAQGTATGLKVNDPVLLVLNGAPTLAKAAAVEAQFDQKRTKITLQAASGATASPATSTGGGKTSRVMRQADQYSRLLAEPPAQHPQSAVDLVRSPSLLYAPQAETALALRRAPEIQRKQLFTAMANTPPPNPAAVQAYVFRSHGAPFGASAPPQLIISDGGKAQSTQEWKVNPPSDGKATALRLEIDFALDLRVSVTEFFNTLARRDESHRMTESVAIRSTISFGGQASVKLPPRAGASASAPLGQSDQVEVVLSEFEPQPAKWTLQFSFKEIGLTLVVKGLGSTVTVEQQGVVTGVLTLNSPVHQAASQTVLVTGSFQPSPLVSDTETGDVIYLDTAVDTIMPGSWIVLEAPPLDGSPVPAALQVDRADVVTRVSYGQTAKTTRVQLKAGQPAWIDPNKDGFNRIRSLRVHSDSALLVLADADIAGPLSQTADDPTLELDGLYQGLTSGRWAIVQGQRSDLPSVTSAELVMIAGATHGYATDAAGQPLAGDTIHTTLTLASPLSYTYLRDTVTISGNVVPATQGQSVLEVLGSGNSATPGQSFTLKKPPLTYVAAATPTGNASTLKVRVNGQAWQEVADFTRNGPNDRVFVTSRAVDGTVTVRFGDGEHGARLPTGTENVQASYRSGLGLSGNVEAATITTLMSRPLGVKSVSNPVAASGGAEAESPNSLRQTAPLGLASLDRLVSVQDYADFARGFAGVAKASAARFAAETGLLVQVTVAAAGEADLPAGSALPAALLQAYRDYGSADQPIQIAERTAILAVIHLQVGLQADADWADVEPALRQTLLDRLGFDVRDLGQSLYRSDVIAAAQSVAGVSYVDLVGLTGVAEAQAAELGTIAAQAGVADVIAKPAGLQIDPRTGARTVTPADLVYLSSLIPDLLLMEQVGA